MDLKRLNWANLLAFVLILTSVVLTFWLPLPQVLAFLAGAAILAYMGREA